MSLYRSPLILATPAPRGSRVGVRTALGAVAVSGILCSAYLGWATAQGRMMLLAPILAIAAYIVLAHTDQAAFATIIITASTFSSIYALPKVSHFFPAELCLFLGLGLLLFSNYRSFGGVHGVLTIILLVTITGGVFVAKANGVTTLDAIGQARTMVLYASFWVALAALRANPTRFFKMIAAFTVLITALSVAQFLLPGHRIFRSSGETFVSPEGAFTRVRGPGLVLVYIALIFAIAYLLWGPRRARRRALAFAGIASVAIVISLNRNMIIGAVFGLIAALLVTQRRRRATMVLAAAGLATAVALSVAATTTIGSRILLIGNPRALQAQTLSDRAYENRFAVAVIKRHLAFGIGWAAPYGAQLAQQGTGSLSPRGFIHNQYYGLLLRTGITGLLTYLGLLGMTAFAGFRWTRLRIGTPEGWLGPAVLASVIAFAASSVVGIYVIDPGSSPAVVALFAVGALLREHLAQARAEPDAPALDPP